MSRADEDEMECWADEDEMECWADMLAAFSDKIIACTLSDEEMAVKFYAGFGSEHGRPFTAWSEKWVYFPHEYDGAETIRRAPRNPGDAATNHGGFDSYEIQLAERKAAK